MTNLDMGRGIAPFTITLTFLAVVMLVGPINTARADFNFKKIVDTHTPVPGGGGANFNFNGSDVPAVSGDRVVFDTADMTIWTATRSGNGLRKLITSRTRIPGGWGRFRQFFGNYVQIHGETIVVIADNCGGCGSGVGIFTRTLSDPTITKLVDRNDTSQTFPGDDKNFGGFSPDFRVADNTVVFTNRQAVFAVPITGGAVTPVAGAQTQGVAPPSPFCCNFSEPSVKDTTIFMRGGNVFGRSALDTVRKNGNPTTFRFIATNGTHPPQTPPDYRFDDFEFFSPVIDQALIFGGASTVPGADPPQPYIRGIYSRSDRFKRLVDTNVPVPGGTGNFVFDWYGTASPILASNGIVVFGARDAADIPGLYAVRQDGGPIHKVIARGDPINGFIAQDFNVSRQGLSGNVLVFSVSYASFQGAGMYSTLVVLP